MTNKNFNRPQNNDDEEKPRTSPPAMTPEVRENQLIKLTMDLAEQQLRDGTATSQVMTHFLRLGTEKTKLEIEKLKNETAFIQSKVENLESQKKTEELYEQALDAMRKYSGNEDGLDEELDEYDDY